MSPLKLTEESVMTAKIPQFHTLHAINDGAKKFCFVKKLLQDPQACISLNICLLHIHLTKETMYKAQIGCCHGNNFYGM